MDEGGGCLICWLFPPFGILEQIFGGPPSPPNAPPAPPGGYGAGIDPYGTWDEKLPAGVQVFPSVIPGMGPGGSGCTYGQGSCGGGVYGFTLGSAGGNSNPIWLDGFIIQVLVLDFIAPNTGGHPDRKSLIQHAKDLWPTVKYVVCGSSPRNGLRAWLIEGGTKGALLGAGLGALAGSVLEPGGGTVLGGVAGAAEGAIEGASVAAVGGVVAVTACSAFGLYN
jgi:hypothetical protein